MNYFYILIKKENIKLLQDTVELIKKNCLKNSNIYSINLNKNQHSNCLLDKPNDNYLKVYNSENETFEKFLTYYIEKYKVSLQDLDILFQIYNNINIEEVIENKVQVKIVYSISFINALQFIVDLLGREEILNQILFKIEGENFTQVISNNYESESAIIENNVIYTSLFENGSFKKNEKLETNTLLIKYHQYKKLNQKLKNKEFKQLNKI